ncbi:MAG: XRE family transcriptional regulator [Candidatus Fimivivens sp.]|nr:XRE family transcriptional regulator [Candidatus Fimivivens sp.]
MNDIYKKIETLCKSRSVDITTMCKEAKISRAIMSEFKMGRTKELSTSTLSKLSGYFNVSVDYLLGKEDQKENAPALNTRDERDIAKDMERLRQNLESGEGLMFDGDPLSDEAKESILAAMKIGLEMAKVKNKERYTPKKFRKENNNA